MALPEDRAIPEEKFPEKVRRFVASGAPKQLQMMLAKGTVPMPPAVQACALHQLMHVGDAEVQAAVTATVQGLPPGAVQGVAREGLPAVVLDWLAHTFSGNLAVLTELAGNRQADDETLVFIATKADEPLCERLALNQERLARCAPLVEALYYNDNTRMSTAARIVEFAARSGLDLTHLPGFEEVLSAIDADHVGADVDSAEADAVFKEILEEGTDDEPTVRAIESAADALAEEEPEASKRPGDAYSRVKGLSIAQKVRLALLGNKSERAVLIRDTNRVVYSAVIRSPAVSDQEAMAWAANRSLPDDVITYIARKRQWIRHYQVKLNLVKNPKTPMPIAMTFLRMLRPSDLRGVSRSKSVPGAVAKAAKNILSRRN